MEKKQSVRELKKEKTKLTLVSKAVQLFSEKGFENIGMRQLAAESSLGLGTYYNYFKSKDEIIFSIFDSIFTEVFDVNNKPQYSHTSLEDDLFTFIHSRFALLEEHESGLLNYVQTVSNPKHFMGEDTPGLEATRKSAALFWLHIQELFTYHKAELSEEDMELIPRFLWHQFINFLYIHCINEYDSKQRDQFITLSMSMVCQRVK